jgi:hypothetical protein
MKRNLPLLLATVLWPILSVATENQPVVITADDGSTHIYFPSNNAAPSQVVSPPVDDGLPIIVAPDPDRIPDEEKYPVHANPRLVVDKNGNQKVEIFGEIRDKSEIGIDVDGDKITEMVDDKLRKTPLGDSVMVVMHINKPIDDAILEETKRVGTRAKITAIPEGFIYVTAP